MKIAIYSPYLDTFGGGEKYMMTIAEVLSQTEDRVDVLLDKHLKSFGSDYLKEQLRKRFDLDLNKTIFIEGPIGEGSNFLERLLWLKNYDILFYLTDGSIFYPTSRRNILHIQTPLVGQPSKSLWGKLKLKGWETVIFNSNFTKKYSEKNWPLKSKVIYPPVDIDKIKPLKKKKYIISVGRFFGYLKDKKHQLLIEAFRELFENKQLSGWSLHLVGSASEGDKPYLEELKVLANNLPVNFYPNLEYDKLVKLYGQSLIYWHASGFGEKDPSKMEHFGISCVEAMAGGCIPVVINKGGLQEIVENYKSGFLWDIPSQLNKYTMQIIKSENLQKKLSLQSQITAKKFSKDKFVQRIKELVEI